MKIGSLHTSTVGNWCLFKDDISTLKCMHVSALQVNH